MKTFIDGNMSTQEIIPHGVLLRSANSYAILEDKEHIDGAIQGELLMTEIADILIIGGGVMEAFVDPDGATLDMWPPTLGMAGFPGGAVFSMIIAIAARRRTFDELSLVRFGALGRWLV